MKGSLLSLLVLFFSALHAQESVSALDYAGRDIIVPEGCSAKSAYEIFDCDGFSAQWLYLKEDMVNQGVHLQLFDQFDQQIEYAEKAKRNFYSQNELFEGVQ